MAARFTGRIAGSGGRRSLRGTFIAASWIAGLVGVVGIGLFGARSAPAPQAVEVVASPEDAAEDIADAGGWVRLDSPARADEVFASHAITVRGEVGPSITAVWLGLESRTGKILATRTIQRGDLSVRAPMPFEGLFGLASPSASGRLFVTATAIGPDGIPTQSIRRRIETRADVPKPDDPRGPDLPQSPHADVTSDDPGARGLHRGPHADFGIDGPVFEPAGG